MSISHILILGLFVFFGSLGLAAIQSSVSRIWLMLRNALVLKKPISMAFVPTSENRKLSWK